MSEGCPCGGVRQDQLELGTRGGADVGDVQLESVGVYM